jgi:hypothetical protein
MALTTTKSVDFQTLSTRGQSAAIVVKLMMACNDLTVTDQALAGWKKEGRTPKQTGACMYFIRAQISHLHEGLKVIAKLQQNKALSMLVNRCDSHTQQCFRELEQYVADGPKRKRFEQLAGKIRHKLTFHYDESGKLIERAISDRAARPEAKVSSITRGNTMHLWHFKVADDVVDSIVVRQIWNIPRDADLRAEADAIAEHEVHKIVLWFLDFSGEFIWKYCDP